MLLQHYWHFNTSPLTRGFSVDAETEALHKISILPLSRGDSELAPSEEVYRREFQYFPSHEGILILLLCRKRWRNFNTSPLTRGFHRCLQEERVRKNFNTSPLTRGFCFQVCSIPELLYFNTSPLTRGFLWHPLRPSSH